MLFPQVGRQQRRVRFAWWSMTAFLCLGILLHLFPIFFMLITSFKSSREVVKYPPSWWPNDFSLDAWRLVFHLATGDPTIAAIMPGGALYVYFVNSVEPLSRAFVKLITNAAIRGYHPQLS